MPAIESDFIYTIKSNKVIYKRFYDINLESNKETNYSTDHTRRKLLPWFRKVPFLFFLTTWSDVYSSQILIHFFITKRLFEKPFLFKFHIHDLSSHEVLINFRINVFHQIVSILLGFDILRKIHPGLRLIFLGFMFTLSKVQKVRSKILSRQWTQSWLYLLLSIHHRFQKS